MRLIKKALFRGFRILTGRKGVYGTVLPGGGNKYAKGVLIDETAIIGHHNYFSLYAMINHAVIGNYCSIGSGVKIGQGIHSKDYITTCQRISRDLVGHSLLTEPVVIGNDVWCGANVIIMQGVRVGDGAVIGAGAVVTRDIPDYAIAVGVPAKVIRYRFDAQTIAAIKDTKWFEKGLDEAKKIVKSLEEYL